MEGCANMPLLRNEKKYTVEDIYNLPEDERAELIDGQIYYMAPAPKPEHQLISSFLHVEIGSYIKQKGGSCKVLAAPFAVFLDDDNSTYVEPDISVICNTEKLDSKGYHGAPDWIIEIVSPGSKQMDYFTKLFKYLAAGVREYWIVDPQKDRITVYDSKSKTVNDFTFSDTVTAAIYGDLHIDFSELTF